MTENTTESAASAAHRFAGELIALEEKYAALVVTLHERTEERDNARIRANKLVGELVRLRGVAADSAAGSGAEGAKG